MNKVSQGIRAAQTGLLVNAVLVVVKLLAGVVGNAYALVADAVESSADIFSSLIVWRGLRVTARPPDDSHPYGYGKAEPLAAAVVSLLLLGAGGGVAIAAVREILTPHSTPAAWTLVVAGAVVVVKELLYRRVVDVGHETGARQSRPTHGTTGPTPSVWPPPLLVSPSPSGAAPAGRRPTTGRHWWLPA